MDSDKGGLDVSLQKAPENYRKAVRLGAYGGFIKYYLCGCYHTCQRPAGRTVVFLWIKQERPMHG